MSASIRSERFEAGPGLERLAHMAELMLPALSADGPGMELPPGRKLALDESRSAPASARSFIYFDLLSAFSHIDAIVAISKAGVIYPHVPMTLLRPAIESSASAIWLLEPTSRDERARRAVLRGLQSLGEFERFAGEVAGEDRQHEALREGLTAAADRLGLDVSSGRKMRTLLKAARTTDVFDAIAHISDGELRRKGLWRVCSAWSHNDHTLIANLSPILEEEGGGAGTMRVRIEAREDVIELCAWGIGLDLSRALSLTRAAGIGWPGNELAVSEAIALFANSEVREQNERRVAQLTRRPRR